MKFEHLQGPYCGSWSRPSGRTGVCRLEVLTQLLERQIAAGTDGILTLGTTGEYSTMTHEGGRRGGGPRHHPGGGRPGAGDRRQRL